MDKQIRRAIQQKLVTDYSSLLNSEHPDAQRLREATARVIDEVVRRTSMTLSDEARHTLAKEIIDELIGYGPIECFMSDPLVTEIMVNGPKKIFVERAGHKALTDVTFEDDRHLMQFIHRMLAPTRRRVDESNPFTEISLSDGARINIIIPPLALDGPTVTIRRFSREIKKMEDLIALGTLDKRMADFLVASIRAKLNIIFIGPTGVGKTTTLNVLSSYIPESERIVTIEDTAELQLHQEHVVRLEARLANIEGKGEVGIRELFRNSLRMRPDRIIIGEIRGSEALDMLQGICSGHTGSMAILHANSPQDAIYRIETMIMSSGVPIGMEAIHRQIVAAINLIVHQEHMLDGTRKISSITQIAGRTSDGIKLEDLFVYEMESYDTDGRVQGRWHSSGILPVFFPLFKKRHVELSEEIFRKD